MQIWWRSLARRQSVFEQRNYLLLKASAFAGYTQYQIALAATRRPFAAQQITTVCGADAFNYFEGNNHEYAKNNFIGCANVDDKRKHMRTTSECSGTHRKEQW